MIQPEHWGLVWAVVLLVLQGWCIYVIFNEAVGYKTATIYS